MEKIHIQFTLFSAFYSPLIATMAGGFLKLKRASRHRGLSHRPASSAIKALEAGARRRLSRAAPSQGFTSLGKGETPTAVHFAQINEMDGFFLTGARSADPAFSWQQARRVRKSSSCSAAASR